MLLGIGTALALDKLSNRLYTAKEIKEVAQLRIVGVIPFEKELAKSTITKDGSGLIIDPVNYHLGLTNGHNPNGEYLVSEFFEAFRSLYTNIRLLSSNLPIRSLVVSSAAPAEGKSTVAIYLAQAAAALGQRVLLVDTDLRHPSLHERLKLSNREGLTDILSPQSLESKEFPDFNSVLQRSPIEDNLFVLTAGSISLDATKLLASQKMQDLMKKLEDIFDLVIYKAPSLLGLADTYLLASQTDGILLVTSLGKLKRSILEQALDELKVSNTQILGIVTNCVKERQMSHLVKGKN
jgi:capsular exopolysaccharide synthesis family protein